MVRDETGNILCYYAHQLISNKRYKITLLNPQKGKVEWRIDDIEDDTCCISIYEVLLTSTMLEQICQYVCNTHPRIRFLIVDITNTDSDTYLHELDIIISHYREQYDISIALDM